MKIGIITQPLSRNYGGILQNYALQQTLIKLGHTPYTFDLGKYTWKDWGITTIKSIIKKLIGRPYHFPETPSKRNKSEEILRNFVKQHPDNIYSAYISGIVKEESYEKGKELYDLLTPKNQEP